MSPWVTALAIAVVGALGAQAVAAGNPELARDAVLIIPALTGASIVADRRRRASHDRDGAG